jgi:hypothetical protein
MLPTHPAVTKRIDELLARAKEMMIGQQQTLDVLSKSVDLKDFFGIKARASETMDFALKIQWIAAQLNALQNIPYDVASYDQRRRPSSQSMPAVQVEKKEPDEK